MAPGCKNPPTSGEGSEYRRYVKRVSRRRKVHYLHVCRGCWERWRAHGSFERARPVTWDEEDEKQIVQMRREGSDVTEIRSIFKNVPRRTMYDMFHRAGLRARA